MTLQKVETVDKATHTMAWMPAQPEGLAEG
jgi:hypothetical protein